MELILVINILPAVEISLDRAKTKADYSYHKITSVLKITQQFMQNIIFSNLYKVVNVGFDALIHIEVCGSSDSGPVWSVACEMCCKIKLINDNQVSLLLYYLYPRLN